MSKKENKELAVINWEEFEGSGVAEDADNSDIIIPKILLMQGLSSFVADGDAKSGEFRDSLTRELLGSKDAPLRALCFSHSKVWTTFKKEGDKYVFSGTEPVTASNANLPWLEGDIKREVVHQFMVLLVDRGTPVQMEMPYVLSMRTFSVRPAQRLITEFMRWSKARRPSFSRVIEFFPVQKENDKGRFFAIDWKGGRDATLEEMQEVKKWRDLLKETDRMKVHDDEVAPVAATEEAAAVF